MVHYIDPETDEENAVEAGVLPLNDNGATAGHFAWWVGDEGVKAKFNLDARGLSSDENDNEAWLLAQSALQSPSRMGMAAVDGLSDLLDYGSLSAEDLRIVSSKEDIGMMVDEGVSNDAINSFHRRRFHDMTFASFGVLSNQRFGGLKKDLSRGLDDQFPETLAGRPLWWLPEPATGNVVKGELWDVLYDYANLYRDYPAWQFAGDVNDSGYEYRYLPHSRTGPEGMDDPRDPSAITPMRFFGPHTTTGRGSFNRQGKNMGANSYYTAPIISRHEIDNWGVNESGVAQGRPVWNSLNPVVLACLWRVGVGSVDLSTYSQSENFRRYDGMVSHGLDPSSYDLRQYDAEGQYEPQNPDNPADEMLYDHPGGGGFGAHPLDLPADWEGRPQNGDHALSGTPLKYYRLHFVLQPVVVLWNPYNTPLQVTDLLISPKFEPWVSIDYSYGAGSGVRPVKVQKFQKGSNAFRVVGDYPHSIDGQTNNPSEAADRFLLADDALMAGGEFKSGIRITDYVLEPGQIEVFSLNQNKVFPAANGGPMVARPINVDAVLVNQSPLKHDFPEGTRINNIQLFYDPDNVPGANGFDGRLNTMSLNIQYLNQELGPGTKPNPFFAQLGQFGPDAVEGEDWSEKHEFELDVAIEDIEVPYLNQNLDINEPFTNVQWFAVIGAQTKRIDEPVRGVPMFSQFNVTRVADRPNPSNVEMTGMLWKAKFYTDPEFQDAIESDEIPFWDGDSEVWNDVDHVVLKELPRQPLSSLGQLMHANLSVNDWDPLYAVGGSYGHPLIESDSLINRFNQRVGSNGVGDTGNLAADVTYLANERLFDDFFFSTIPPQTTDPDAAGYSSTFEPAEVPPFKAFSEEDIEEDAPLPNPRMRYIKPSSGSDLFAWMEQLRDYNEAAGVLLVDGAFNVNSTSVEAWKAVLSSLQNQMIPSASGGENTSAENAENPFLRVSAPLGGNTDTQENLFTGFVSLNDEEIGTLAEAIVEEVKARGPFLSLADFVNRRQEDSQLGMKGALQAALDNSVNTAGGNRFGEDVTMGNGDSDSALWLTDKQGNQLLHTEYFAAKQGSGLPQWILQNDIIRPLAPIMQARSDTFLIRAYGDTTDFAGQTTTKAWCEAVVQRLPEYVNSEANPDASVRPWSIVSHPSGERLDLVERNTELSDENFNFGRRYRIVSFRWLNKDEI